MKKILLFLTLTFSFFLMGTHTVQAKSDTFREGEFIDGVYLVRDDGHTKYYQEAKFFRRNSDNKAAYCMQPFVAFNANTTYNGVTKPGFFDSDKWKRITDIAGFGYGYQNHTSEDWYAITQMMIWEEIEPQNTFYFTDRLNGEKIEKYQKERAEIERLIEESKKAPSFNGQTYHGVFGREVTIEDTNNILPTLTTTNSSAKINGNKLTITNDNPTCHQTVLSTNYRGGEEAIFFYLNPDSQQMMTTGKPLENNFSVTVCFHEIGFKLKKIDKDTKSIESPGEASLKGTVFTLYDKNHKKITDVTFDENMEATIDSNLLDFGTYYLQETKAGVGYQKDETVYEFFIDSKQSNINATLENEVIKGTLKLIKSYGDKQVMQAEPNVVFEIYDKDNNLVQTITTDEEGKASVVLPYGHYTIKQQTTTEGYTKIEPFEVFVKEKKDYEYRIYDYKEEEQPKPTPKIEKKEEQPKEESKVVEVVTVPVPDTYSNEKGICLIGGYFLAKEMAS